MKQLLVCGVGGLVSKMPLCLFVCVRSVNTGCFDWTSKSRPFLQRFALSWFTREARRLVKLLMFPCCARGLRHLLRYEGGRLSGAVSVGEIRSRYGERKNDAGFQRLWVGQLPCNEEFRVRKNDVDRTSSHSVLIKKKGWEWIRTKRRCICDTLNLYFWKCGAVPHFDRNLPFWENTLTTCFTKELNSCTELTWKSTLLYLCKSWWHLLHIPVYIKHGT